jgi:hypothetical protein
MAYHIPHSPLWFKALEAINPQQAAHTRQIIGLAGSSDVCSICGDEEAHDYLVSGSKFGRNLKATARLCDDCKQIQTNAGNRFALNSRADRTSERDPFVRYNRSQQDRPPVPDLERNEQHER